MVFKLRPEVDKPVYYVHVLVIVLVVYFLVNFFVEPMSINLINVLLGVVFVTIGDVISHSLLGFD